MGNTVDGTQSPAPVPPQPKKPQTSEGQFEQKSVKSVLAEASLSTDVAKSKNPVPVTTFHERVINQQGVSNKQKTIPESIDCGVKVNFHSVSEPVYFKKTEKSVLPDETPKAPVTYEMMSIPMKERIATGSNGFVQSARLNGKEDVVMKRSYCAQGVWDEKTYTVYFSAPAISREAGILTGLKNMASDHPGYKNIVPFRGSGVTSIGEPLILLTRADGALSEQLLEKAKDPKQPQIPGKPLPFDKTLGFAQDLFSGLSCLASLQLVHQDLKPENLLFKDNTLWIADFGESTCHEGFAAMGIHGNQLTMSERRAGTGATKPFFLTYEEPTPATDIWAGGLVVLQMLNPAKAESYINRINNQPLKDKGKNGISFDKLTPEQLSELKTHCQQTVQAFIDESLTGANQSHRPAMKVLLNRLLDPDPGSRISALDACEQLKVMTQTLKAKPSDSPS